MTVKRILFLFSDTGGGHRSASQAIIEAISAEYGDTVQTEMIDFLRAYYPWPYSKMPEIYRASVKYPRFYRNLWYSTNKPLRARLLMDSNRYFPRLQQRHHRLLREHPADLIVITHYMAIPPLLWWKRRQHAKTCVVVTDLVSTHATWFRRGIDRYIVPTDAAYAKAVEHRIPPERIQTIGLPIAERFGERRGTKAELRRELGWPQAKPVVLLIGGGDGMGRIAAMAHAIAQAKLDITLVVITGRNRQLKATLEAEQWEIPTFVYGFVDEMERYMQSADILCTKAGPSTICEGLASHLPIILYDYLPGQEEGNVTYVEESGAGCYTPEPAAVTDCIRTWLANPATLAQRQQFAAQLANPHAARQIARQLVAQIDTPRSNERSSLQEFGSSYPLETR